MDESAQTFTECSINIYYSQRFTGRYEKFFLIVTPHGNPCKVLKCG